MRYRVEVEVEGTAYVYVLTEGENEPEPDDVWREVERGVEVASPRLLDWSIAR